MVRHTLKTFQHMQQDFKNVSDHFTKLRSKRLNLFLSEYHNQCLWRWLKFYFFQIINNNYNSHCVKSIQIRSFFWSVFSRIRTEYGEILRTLRSQSECGKIRTRKNLIFWHFSSSDYVRLIESNEKYIA